MTVYVVSYDLLQPGRDYATLYAALERAGARRILYSQWLLRTNQTAVQVRDALRAYIDANDRLFVNALGTAWAGLNLITDPNQF